MLSVSDSAETHALSISVLETQIVWKEMVPVWSGACRPQEPFPSALFIKHRICLLAPLTFWMIFLLTLWVIQSQTPCLLNWTALASGDFSFLLRQPWHCCSCPPSVTRATLPLPAVTHVFPRGLRFVLQTSQTFISCKWSVASWEWLGSSTAAFEILMTI